MGINQQPEEPVFTEHDDPNQQIQEDQWSTGMKEVSRLASRMSPSLTFLILICSILVSEVLIMSFIGIFPPLPRWGVLLLNTILPSVLILPIIYFFIFRPLNAHITERNRIEEALRESEDRFCRMAEEVSVIAEIGRVIGSSLEINEVYERFAAEARKLIPFDRITVTQCNVRENIITIAYASGADLSNHKQGDSLPLAGTLIEDFLRKRTGQIIQSEKMDEVVGRIPAFSRTFRAGLRSIIGIPLIYKDEAIGVLQFRSKTPNAYTEQNLRLAEQIGEQIAGAIAHAKLFCDRKRAEEELRRNQDVAERLAKEMAVIAEIGLVIGSTLNINEVYERFAAETQNLIPIDSLTVNLYNSQENTMHVAYVSGLDIDGRRQGDSLVLKGSLSEAVIRTRTGIRIQPASFDEIADQFPRLSPIFQAGLRSIMCVPLVYRDEVIGVLHFRSKKQNAYTEQDLRLAERIGMQIAGTIANAQLYSDIEKTGNSLRKSEGRFRGLVEKAAVGVAEIDMNTGQFLMVNSRLCEMMGRTEDEMLNTTFQAITHPEDLRLHEEKTQMMLAGEIGHYSLEKRYLRKDGGIVWVNLTVSPLWKPGEGPGHNMIVVEDITERKRIEAEIIALSVTDQLTGLYNRRGFMTIAEQQMRVAERTKTGMLVLYADLDGLKQINDKLGHKSGDEAIAETANVLKEVFRKVDIIARMGGDEFAVLAPEASLEHEDILKNRLQDKLDTHNSRAGRDYNLSLSIGILYHPPPPPNSLDELISRSDSLMYEQKRRKKPLECQKRSDT